MQRTYCEGLFAYQCIQQGRFTGANTAKHGEVKVAMIEFVEHGLHGIVIMRK